MGFFSKARKQNPKITFEGIEFTFQGEHEWWEFAYRGTGFRSFATTLLLSSKTELDSVLDTVAALKPEMRTRMAKGLSEWGDSKLDDGESYSINMQEFARDKTFTVSWSSGASWGDMGVDFIIKGNEIIDEMWGD